MSAFVKCPTCGEDLHNVDLGARATAERLRADLAAARQDAERARGLLERCADELEGHLRSEYETRDGELLKRKFAKSVLPEVGAFLTASPSVPGRGLDPAPFQCCADCKTETACIYARDCNYCELAASEIPGFGTARDRHRCPKFHRERPLTSPSDTKGRP